MARSNDWLPTTRGGQLAMAKTWNMVLNTMAEEWGVPDSEKAKLNSLLVEVAAAENAAKAAGGGAVANSRVREAYTALRSFMRNMKRLYFLSPPLSETDLVSLGLRPRDTNPTAEPVPDKQPEIEAITAVIRELTFRFRDFGSGRWALPEHVHGIEFIWDLRETRPEHIHELSNVEILSSGPYTLKFDEDRRGKRVFFAARWFNNTKKEGPWSDIESAVIP